MFEDMLVSQKPTNATTLFIDMDSFFASVEQQYNPSLRARPVAVCPCLGDGCMVVAASIEAKRMGIGVGTRIREAKQICPDIVLVADSPHKYREVHTKIMDILNQTVCHVRAKSIDEAWLKLPFYLIGTKPAHELASTIKNNIKENIGEFIGSSVGIAPNIWLAKMAASFYKPDGLYEISLDQLEEFYSQLRLPQLNGISRGLTRQCYLYGINSVSDLYNTSLPQLRKLWGVNGVKWYLRLRGYEVDIMRLKSQQTLSHQTTLMPKPAETIAQTQAVLTKMAYRLGKRLRANHQTAAGVGLYLGYSDMTYFVHNLRVTASFCSNNSITNHLYELLSLVKDFRPVRRVSVVLFNLRDEAQLRLDINDSEEKQIEISHAVDELNLKYGANTIIPASSLGRDIFPDRIGFGNSKS